MICIITDPIDLGKYIEADNIARHHPGSKITHFKWADFTDLESTETLYLVAHGNTGSVEGRTPKELAQQLVDRNLLKPIHKIKLTSCGSGVTGGIGAPYCQRLADAIVAKGGPRTVVVGFDGNYATTDEFGKTYAKDLGQPQYRNWNEFQANWGSGQSEEFKKFDHWNAIAKSSDFSNETNILSTIQSLKGPVDAMFRWVYANNRQYNKGKVAGKTYGIPGQVFS